ncbi:MAG TPA: N-acetylmannosamine-6-phosphate 2-epimerase [Firmicutes bacterium]|nr:N-acetylmannosamine-6-phosphate 2-epimerase [Bacillota bacterium]
MKVQDFVHQIKGRLIVSCQALPETPLDNPEILAAMAKSVELGGASGLRAQGARNISAIREVSKLPIIGLYKTLNRDETFITPHFENAKEIAAAGADIIALQATNPRLGDCDDLPTLTSKIHTQLGLGVIADISTLVEAEEAVQAGADLVATTLSGYTPHTLHRERPDLDLVYQIAGRGIPVIAEGRYHSPEQVIQALDNGALAVVVGTMITMPDRITRYFIKSMDRATRD